MSNFKFIINPMAANGKCAKIGKIIYQLCKDKGLDFNIEYTNKAKEAIEISRRAVEQFEFIVAVGGDGTINEVVNGVVNSKSKLGIIPAGSGNDFIRSLSIPRNFLSSFHALINMKTCTIDLGKVGHFYFINGVGIGFDAWVVKTLMETKRLFRKAKYFYGVFKSIYKYKPEMMQLSYNTNIENDRYFMINIGNGHSMGGGFKLTPYAKLDDGLLDLNIVTNLTKLEIYKNLIKVRSGKHTEMPQVKITRTTHLKVESEDNFAAHMDGELISLNLKSLDISVLAKAIEVVIAND